MFFLLRKENVIISSSPLAKIFLLSCCSFCFYKDNYIACLVSLHIVLDVRCSYHGKLDLSKFKLSVGVMASVPYTASGCCGSIATCVQIYCKLVVEISALSPILRCICHCLTMLNLILLLLYLQSIIIPYVYYFAIIVICVCSQTNG